MKLSVVMPTRNRAASAIAAVTALLADDDVHEIVVVDDGSTDDTFAALQELAASDDRLLALTQAEGGKASAEELGVRAAAGEVVLLLDDDVIAEPGLAAGHLAHHRRARGLVVIGYMPVPSIPREPGHGAEIVYQQDYERTCQGWEADPSTILHNLWGGNVSIRRDDALRIGLTSEAHPKYARHVDRDFGLRCLQAGLRGVFDRSLRAQHRYRRSIETLIEEARSQAIGMVHVHRAHGHVVGALDDDRIVQGLTPARALVMRIGARPLTHRPTVRALALAATLASRMGRRKEEVALTRLLRRTIQARHIRMEHASLQAHVPR